MKITTQNTTPAKRSGKNSTLIITCCMLICIATGWVLGSASANALSRSDRKNTSGSEKNNEIILPSIALNGEALPTIMLSEFSVCNK